jgi:hypothetical protein
MNRRGLSTCPFLPLLPFRHPVTASLRCIRHFINPCNLPGPWLSLLTCGLGVRHRGMASGAAATLATLQPRRGANWAL